MTDDYDEELLMSLRIQLDEALDEAIYERNLAIMRIADIKLEIAEVRGRIDGARGQQTDTQEKQE
jgi:hypothetical protein